MGTNYMGNAGVFLIQTLFGLYILAIMLRFLLQWARADFYNPVSQFLVKITNPPLRPLRRIIPGLMGLDMAAIAIMLALQMIELFLVGMVVGQSFHPLGVLVMSISELLSLLLNVYIITILIQAVLSWIHAGGYHPMISLLHQLNEPVLRPARRIIPPIAGMDLSPLVVLILMQLLSMLLVRPISDIGLRLAMQ